MPEFEVEEGKTSKYNSAMAQIYRTDNLLQAAHYNIQRGNLIKAMWILDRVWVELAPDSNDDAFKKEKEFTIRIAKAKKKKTNLYFILKDKEIFLRRLQNVQGKGTAYANQSEDDFE